MVKVRSLTESVIRQLIYFFFFLLYRKGSFIVLEIDPRQVETIRRIVQENGSYRGDISVRKDCFGVDRFVILRCE